MSKSTVEFRKIQDSEYVCSVWFERDRKNVSLSTPRGRVIFDLWDEDVDEAIVDGFLGVPKLAHVSGTAMNSAELWQPHAVAYARNLGLI